MRPCFELNGYPVVSAGVLPYVRENGNILFMVQKIERSKTYNWDYEDFGGKSDETDKSIKDVAYRECAEELNRAAGFTEEFLYSLEQSDVIVVPNSKYALHLVKLPHRNFDVKEFGTTEILTGIKREVVWLSYKEFMEASLHPRLITKELCVLIPLTLATDW
jgi:8-oxo-dGTP pyrophosphatase MutT (NUDIX family)